MSQRATRRKPSTSTRRRRSRSPASGPKGRESVVLSKILDSMPRRKKQQAQYLLEANLARTSPGDEMSTNTVSDAVAIAARRNQGRSLKQKYEDQSKALQSVKSVFESYTKKGVPTTGRSFDDIAHANKYMEKPAFYRFMKDHGLFPGVFRSKGDLDALFRQLNLMSRHFESRLRLSLSQFEKFCEGVLQMKFPQHSRSMSTEQALQDWRINAQRSNKDMESMNPIQEKDEEPATGKEPLSFPSTSFQDTTATGNDMTSMEDSIGTLRHQIVQLQLEADALNMPPIEHDDSYHPNEKVDTDLLQTADKIVSALDLESSEDEQVPAHILEQSLGSDVHSNNNDRSASIDIETDKSPHEDDRLTNLRDQLEHEKKVHENSSLKIKALEEELDQSRMRISRMDSAWIEQRNEIEKMRHQYGELLKQAQKTQAELADLQKEKQGIEAARFEVDAEKTILHAEVTAMELKLREAELRAIDEKECRKRSQQSSIEDRRKAALAEEKFLASENEVQKLRREVQGLQAKEDLIWQQVEAEQSKNRQVEGEQEKTQEFCEELQLVAEKAMMERTEAMMELQVAAAEKSELRLQLSKSQERLESLSNASERKIKGLMRHQRAQSVQLVKTTQERDQLRRSSRQPVMELEMSMWSFLQMNEERSMLEEQIQVMQSRLDESAESESVLQQKLAAVVEHDVAETEMAEALLAVATAPDNSDIIQDIFYSVDASAEEKLEEDTSIDCGPTFDGDANTIEEEENIGPLQHIVEHPVATWNSKGRLRTQIAILLVSLAGIAIQAPWLHGDFFPLS